jgi:hypothetical protein
MTLEEIRATYPQYQNAPDDVLVNALYKKGYEGRVDFETFSKAIGYTPQAQSVEAEVAQPEVVTEPIQQQEAEQPLRTNQGVAQATMQTMGATNPVIAGVTGVAELAAQAGGGFAGLVAGGYQTALNLFNGEDLKDQGKKVESIISSTSYDPKTKTAKQITDALTSVSKNVMTFPSMMYSSIGVMKGILTREEKEGMLAEAEMDRASFANDPFRTIGEDVLNVTGSPEAAAGVSTGLLAMSMMLGANSPRQISALNKASDAKKTAKIKDFQLQVINNQLDPTSDIDPTTKLVQYDKTSKKIKTISPWQLANETEFSPVQRAELGAYITKNKPAQDAIKSGMSEANVALFGGLSPTDSAAALRMMTIVKGSKKSPLFAGKNRTTDVVGKGIVERYRFLKAKNISAGRKLRQVIKRDAQTPVVFDSAISKFQRDLNDEGITIGQTDGGIAVDYGSSALGESVEAVKLIDGIVKRLASKGGQTLQQGHFLKKYIDENSGLQKVSEGLTQNSKRIIGNLRKNVNLSLRQASPDYKDANIAFSDTIEVIGDLQKLAGKSIDLDGANSRSSLGTAFRGMLSNRQSRQAQVDLIGKMDKISGKYGATFNDSIYNQMIVASKLEDTFNLAPANSFQGQVKSGVGGGIIDMTVDPSMAAARASAGILDKVLSRSKGKAEQNAIDAIEKILKEQIK